MGDPLNYTPFQYVSIFFHMMQVQIYTILGKSDKVSATSDEIAAMFRPVDKGTTLTLNTISKCIFLAIIVPMAGLSEDLKEFIFKCHVLPLLVGSVLFYYFRFGTKAVHFSLQNIVNYANNWLLMFSMSLVNLGQIAILYKALVLIEPLLPASLQGTLIVPQHVTELYYKHVIYIFWGLTVFSLVTIPLWKKGHRIAMQAVEQSDDNLGMFEMALEIMYQGCNHIIISEYIIIGCVLGTFGYHLHTIHLVSGALELVFINQVYTTKFDIFHRLTHKIPSLYNLSHLEHHICKGTYCNTTGHGLWESWLVQGGGYTLPFLFPLPYLVVQHAYCGGVNFLVHTMWPSKTMLSWHTLHHVVLADIYSVNIPSKTDREQSKKVREWEQQLQFSLFIRKPEMNDLVALIGGSCGVAFWHYCIGFSLFSVWHELKFV